MSRTVLEAPLRSNDVRAAFDRRRVALVAFVVAEFAAIALPVGNRAILTPVNYHGPLSSYQPTPLAGHLPSIGYSLDALRVAYLLLLALMFALYLFVLRGAESLSLRLIVATLAIAQLLAFLGPLVVTDVYNYIDFARLAVVHHVNPYIHAPATAPQDPLFHLAAWPLQPTSYGPLFTIGTFPLAELRPSHAVWAVKVVALLGCAVCAAFVYACALRRGRPARACLVAFGLNPLVLVYALGGAHNDFLMLALILAGVYLLLGERRRSWAGPAMVVAAGIKATAAPVLLFALLRERRVHMVALSLLTALVVAAVTVAVFGVHAPGFTAQSKVLTPLSLPDLVARLFGVDASQPCALVYTCARPGVRALSTAVLVAGTAVLLWRAWRGADWITSIGWMMALVIVTLTSVMPWYIVWILPFAALSRSRRLHFATAAITVLLVVGSVPATYLLTSH